MFGISSAATGKTRSLGALLRLAVTMPWFAFTPVSLMNQNKGVFGVNMGHLWGESERVAGWMEVLLRYYQEATIRPVIAARYSFAEAADAHHYLQDRKNLGKVVLVP